MHSIHISIDKPLRQINRFGMLARYIETHLDTPLNLAQLAEVANLSKHRLDSSFQAYAHETPMDRVWRLRLQRARQTLIVEPKRSLLDIACEAGYSSTQAFSRAFSRRYGQTPSSWRQHAAINNHPSLRIEYLPAIAIQYIPYRGQRSDLQSIANELRARAMACGIERHRRFGWAVNIQANLYASTNHHIDTEAALLHAPLAQKISGLDLGQLQSGSYAVFRFERDMHIPAAPLLITRIETETGWRAIEGPWLRRCRNTQHLPSRLDRCFEIYIPVEETATANITKLQAFIWER